MLPPTSSATNTLTPILTAMMITHTIIITCTTATLPRSALPATSRFRARHCDFSSTRCSRISDLNLLRVKGLINVAEEPDRPAVIQGAQHLLHNLTFLERWPDADRRSKIVFITQGFDRAEVEDMIGLLDRVATRTAAARARAQAQTAANE